jgi:hypothetical protein
MKQCLKGGVPMLTGKAINHVLLFLFLAAASAVAIAQPGTMAQPSAPKANLMIERQLVRFDLQGTARSWQIEVFNQAGELIFASGVVNQQALEWALADRQENPLADGLYAYTLRFWNENNEQASVQRGHIIINRASRDDRIWVTSNNATGVGSASELTVVGSTDSTVGGARLLETRASATGRSVDASTNTQQIKDNGGVINAVGPITGDGTANRIAKFTGANTIDDSVMTETGGNIQVGTNSNLARLTAINTNVRGIYGGSDTAAGVWGQSISSSGVYGYSSTGIGAYGSSLNGLGVQGMSSTNHGVYGTTAGANFAGVFGINGVANSKGVWGTANNGSDAVGVYGESTDGRGVFGRSQTGAGVRGQSDSGPGVYGFSANGKGIWGVSSTSYGAQGQSNGNHGVYGRSSAPKLAGVFGQNLQADGIGVRGEGNTVGGTSNVNQTSTGVLGIGGGWGVRGESTGGHGVAGYGSFLGASIYGASGAAWAGYFNGDVVVDGTLQVNNNFGARMDHPLDPANKYLNLSFVESAEMMSVQNGNVITDANGEAIVTLPDYFQAISGDFRYQLTVVGQFAQAIVARKIEGNRFTIKTDKPNVEVSWQVTGLRQDAAANANRKPAEESKPEAERGYYLRPALFNQTEEKGIEWARNPEMMKRMKAEREQTRKAQP